MTEPYVCNDAALISCVEGFDALPALLRMLARGEAVTLDQLISASGPTAADLWGGLRAQPGTEWGGDGSLVGFGLTSRPTEHRLLIGDKTLYTWCASDTLFFTVILGQETVAESRCPATGVVIRVELTPERIVSITPEEAVVSQRHRGDLVADLRSDICDHGHFFASTSAATAWVAEHPDARVRTIADAFDEGRATCVELGWYLPTRSGR